jgi:hypothetical protein
MDNMEKIRKRNAQRLDESVLDPVEVRSVNDIKRLIAEFDPAREKQHDVINIETNLVDDDTYSVNADTKSRSKREILLEGLTIIKNRMEARKSDDVPIPIEINGILMEPAWIGNAEDSITWVDPLLNQWLGATRKGLLICWDIDGYEYRYRIFDHKLTRVLKNA